MISKAEIEDPLGPLMANHTEIIRELIELIPKRADGNHTRPAWTKAVKIVMEELAQKNLTEMVEFCGTIEHKGTREWLVDVAWYYKTGSEEGIFLALESEWDTKTHAHGVDFSKLLALKAPLKIMLFASHDRPSGLFEEKQAKCIQSFEQLLGKWRQHTQGDLVYAIDFSGGYHTVWLAKVLLDGKNGELILERIDDMSGKDAA